MEKLLNQIIDKLNSMDARLSNLEEGQSSLNSQVSENTQILKSLEHKTDIIKAEQENMKHDVASFNGKLDSIKRDTQDVKETNRSLLEMYGDHEAYIRTLRRRSQ